MMKKVNCVIRNANPDEFEEIGQLMFRTYSQLEGFPGVDEHPHYYKMLSNIGSFTEKPSVELLVAVNENNEVLGTVVYIGKMEYYGSRGISITEGDCVGFRLLAVSPDARGLGIGKTLCQFCIDRAKLAGAKKMIIHTTKAMSIAWKMYERMGFVRSPELDFSQNDLRIFGLKLDL